MTKNEQGKTIAIVSYITIIGWVVALIMNQNIKDKFASFHIRQSLLIVIISAIIGALRNIQFITWILGTILFVFWIMGLIYAINGQEKEVPLIGAYAQQWFKSL